MFEITDEIADVIKKYCTEMSEKNTKSYACQYCVFVRPDYTCSLFMSIHGKCKFPSDWKVGV